MYERTAQHPDFRFFRGVELGADVTRQDLLERYHAVIYAVGAPTDNASPTVERNVAMLREFARREPAGKSHRIELRFRRSPVEILGDGEGGPVTGLRVVRNRLEPDPRGGVRAVATGEEEVIPVGW